MEKYINGTGRRKRGIARVFLKKGSGKITINGKDLKDYIGSPHLQADIEKPLKVVEARNDYDVMINASGGGIKGQAHAIRMGIARALVQENPEYRPALKPELLLRRDSREVERKKPGLRKARKKEQYSKR